MLIVKRKNNYSVYVLCTYKESTARVSATKEAEGEELTVKDVYAKAASVLFRSCMAQNPRLALV